MFVWITRAVVLELLLQYMHWLTVDHRRARWMVDDLRDRDMMHCLDAGSKVGYDQIQQSFFIYGYSESGRDVLPLLATCPSYVVRKA